MNKTANKTASALWMAAALVLSAFASAQAPAPPASPNAVPQTASKAPTAAGGTITGTVKAGTLVLPGVTITAANTLTGKKVFAATDTNGNFTLHISGKGRWVVRAELAAFAPGTKEILFNAENAGSTQRADIDLILLSKQQAQPDQEGQALQQAATAVGRGFQNLGLSQAEGADSGGAPS